MTIYEIEKMTEQEAQDMAIETMEIKGHNIYFVDFEGYFGFSMLIFKNGHHIYHANDYELHHSTMIREELRKWYIDGANNKLFTEAEIMEPIADYDEYSRKEYFLRNYYNMQTDYISVFFYGTDEEKKKRQRQIKKMSYNPVSFCYMNDSDFIAKHQVLFLHLQERKNEMKDNFDYWVKAFVREMYNHEYGINWQADFDTLSAFGNLEWGGHDDDLESFFNQLDFTDTQRKAYIEARQEYYKTCEYC